MKLTLATVITALLFLVAASPTPDKPLNPIKIDLHKRSNLTLPHGSVNIAKLRASVSGTAAKIQCGFAVC